MISLRNKILIVVSLVILIFEGAVLCQAATIGSQLQVSLGIAQVDSELSVIVTFSDKVHLGSFLSGSPMQRRNALVQAMRQKAVDSQKPLNDFLRNSGVKDIKSLWIINGLAVNARPEMIKAISTWPGVEEIRINGTITIPEVTSQAVGLAEWNISAIGADKLWDMGLTGQGVVIASLDTGVDGSHPDFESKWRGWNGSTCDPQINNGTGSWFDPYGQHPNCPFDRDGHGTGTMGIMVGGDTGGTSIGIAPDATWISAKIFNDAGSATYFAIHRAFEWLLDPDGDGDSSDAPDIVNNSWGLEITDICMDEFQPDVQLLKSAGIAVVFSAGNTGPNSSTSISPANYSESLAVGATDQGGAIASFSARGPSPCTGDPIFPQLSAPGQGIKTSGLTFGGNNSDPYIYGAEGTSYAAPHVSGIMALLLEPDGFPGTTVSSLEEALQLSATDLGVEGPDNDFGYGQVNSLSAARRLAGLPHLAFYDPKPPEHDLILDFGPIPVDTDITFPIVIRNSGAGVLSLSANDWSLLNSQFTVSSDTCSSADLLTDEDCRLMVGFSPVAEGLATESMVFSSNDIDQNVVIFSLVGTGIMNPLPAQIEFSAAGQVLDFGSVSPGSTLLRTLSISNAGDAFLTISQIDVSGFAAQFTLSEDNCTGAVLANNESCSVIISFVPDNLAIFQTSVAVISDDPEQNIASVSLTGIGNNPPDSAILVSPPEGTIGLGSSVTVEWIASTDQDGDLVTDTVLLYDSFQSVESSELMVAAIIPRGFLSVKVYVMLFLLVVVLFLFGKKTKWRSFILLFASILLLNSCGGGGADVPVTSGNSSFELTGLNSATTYNWRVVSEDSRGGISESEIWSFTTR